MTVAVRQLFSQCAPQSEVDLSHWTRLCRSNNLSAGSYAVVFAKVTRGTGKKMNETQFAAALAELASREGQSLEEFVAKLTFTQSCEEKKLKRGPMRGPVRFFYDKRTYTGIHKSEISGVEISVHDLSELCDRSQCDARGRKISAAPAPGFATHADIKSGIRRMSASTPSTPRRTQPPRDLRQSQDAEECVQRTPPVPMADTTKENKEVVDLFGNIPAFTFTPVWPTPSTLN